MDDTCEKLHIGLISEIDGAAGRCVLDSYVLFSDSNRVKGSRSCCTHGPDTTIGRCRTFERERFI